MTDFNDSIGDTQDAFAERLDAFEDAAQEVAGPLGILLQSIALARQQYSDAADHHGTTYGEWVRLLLVLEAAMDVTEWLQADTSDVTLVSFNMADLIGEVADGAALGEVLPPGCRAVEPPECGAA